MMCGCRGVLSTPYKKRHIKGCAQHTPTKPVVNIKFVRHTNQPYSKDDP